MSISFTWAIDRTLSGATVPGQSGLGSDGYEGVLRILQSSSIIGALLSDWLVSYPGHSLGESYRSAVMQSVYSTAVADWAINYRKKIDLLTKILVHGPLLQKSSFQPRKQTSSGSFKTLPAIYLLIDYKYLI